ncbi:unnamed protein product [Camellia sinensis]
MRTCVHVAVNHNQIEVVMHLLRWVIGERPDFLYLLSLKDYEGKTAVQFSTSSKQFQTIRVSLPLNPGGSVALDISYDLPHSENIDFEIDGIGEEPRAMIDWDLTKQKIIHSDLYSDNSSYDIPQSENMDSKIDGTLQQRRATTATLFATITFQVPFHLLGSTSKDGYIHDSIMSRLLMLLNSMVFITSVGIIISLLHEFPLKPWPHISISALFGSYMFSLKAVSPNECPALFFILIPILLLGICGKLYGFSSKSLM